MFGLFKRVNERELANAVLAFGNGFYKSLRQSIDIPSVDIVVFQTEFPILAISVANAFIGLRKPNAEKLLASNTKNTAMAYALHFEQITKGKVSAESYAAQLANRLAQEQGMEYTRIMCDLPPEQQPAQLIRQFLQRVGAPVPEFGFEEATEGVAASLSLLVDGMKKAGV